MGNGSLYLFGAPRVEVDGANVKVARRKALALLAYVAVSERAHSRDSLAALLWPEWDATGARTSLRRILVTANKAVGPGILLAEQSRIGLAGKNELWVDVRRFREVLKLSRSHRHTHLYTCEECRSWLREAAVLYTGDFLAGFGLDDAPEFDDWQAFESESQRRDAAEVLEKLAAIYTALRDFAQAIHFARRWLALDPLREAAHQTLMCLYAETGDQSTALRQYQECVDLLQRELGVPPQRETTELFEQIKTGQVVTHPSPLLPSLSAPIQPNLPQTAGASVRLPRLPHFVGRRAELAALGALLTEPSQRLITVLGMGGMGKTSLAVAAAGQVADRFPDGVAFVALAPLSHPSAIVPAIADALHYTFPPDSRPPLQQLIGYLSASRLLLVLDNFEHLLEGGEIVADLLQDAPDVTFLITSRERLNLRAEVLYPLEGMSIGDPDAEADAVRLFVQSTRRLQPGFTPQSEETVAIVEICRLVGGMPLGIVMAAGWMEILGPEEIAAEIRRGPDVLATKLRDIPERQQSMRAVMEQTWARLNDAERDALMRLSVFRGGFTREAAQAVTGGSLRTLLSLANRQLLQRPSEARYDIHEVLRQFAAERLAKVDLLDEAVQAHGNYFVALLERSEAELKGADQQGALERLRVEHENIRIAWDWALEHRLASELNGTAEAYCLFYFFDDRYYEGIELCHRSEERLAKSSSNSLTFARLLTWHGKFDRPLGRSNESKQHFRHSLEILENLAATGRDVRSERAFALCELGDIIWYEDMDAARQLLNESRELCQAMDDRWRLAKVMRELARVSLMAGDYYTAEELALESLRIWEDSGDHRQRGAALSILCWAAMNQDQPERAMAYAQEQRRLGEDLGNEGMISAALFNMGTVHSKNGEYSETQRVQSEALAIAQTHDLHHHASSCRMRLCEVYIHLGYEKEASSLIAVALTKADEIGLRNHRGHILRLLGLVLSVQASHTEALVAFEEGIEIFQMIDQPRFLAEAHAFLAYAYFQAGDAQRAIDSFVSSLAWALQYRDSEYVTYNLPLAALLLADEGQSAQAIELYTLAYRYQRIANSRWFFDIAGRELEALAASLPPNVTAAAQARGRALDLFATAQELAEKFAPGSTASLVEARGGPDTL